MGSLKNIGGNRKTEEIKDGKSESFPRTPARTSQSRVPAKASKDQVTERAEDKFTDEGNPLPPTEEKKAG